MPLSEGGAYSGVATDTLTVAGVTGAHVGSYDVVVTGGSNGAIGATSRRATLALNASMFPDFDFDGLDFAVFQLCTSGPTIPAAPDCVN